MNCTIGIDLGSTTTKAVFVDQHERILGRGITNSRSNYAMACDIARQEAELNVRFTLLEERLQKTLGKEAPKVLSWFSTTYAWAHYLKQLQTLKEESLNLLTFSSPHIPDAQKPSYHKALQDIFYHLTQKPEEEESFRLQLQNNFFRDIASSLFQGCAEKISQKESLSFDPFSSIFDKAMIRVENKSYATYYKDYLDFICTHIPPKFKKYEKELVSAIQESTEIPITPLNIVGTGYGRLTLPFPKHQIRSEILCHGLGAHHLFPKTKTVLDIGGQDTKAIQVDAQGIVTHFQMNDRCAAGCGRYLGYIADEMNMGVQELGPLALKAKKIARINSTCTVFAGAELRERLALGEKREDILAGLHRAIILRAMSLLSRSGGVFSEFTFTGGVARNVAATQALKKLVHQNYKHVVINTSPESIYMGAIGAALFANQDLKRKVA